MSVRLGIASVLLAKSLPTEQKYSFMVLATSCYLIITPLGSFNRSMLVDFHLFFSTWFKILHDYFILWLT